MRRGFSSYQKRSSDIVTLHRRSLLYERNWLRRKVWFSLAALGDPFWQVVGLTPFTVKLSQMRMNTGYKRGSRACVHAMGSRGNLATRVRYKSARELTQGLGHCFLCKAGVCDTQDHFFECTGDCHAALQAILASLQLLYRLELVHALYSFGVPLGRIEVWHNDRVLPKARQPVGRGANGAVLVRVQAETQTLRSLDKDAAVQGCKHMYKDLVRTGAAQAKRRNQELDLWQVVLDQDPHLRLPADMKWDLQRHEQRRKSERKAAKKKAAKAHAPDSGAKGSDGERESASDDESPVVRREKKGEECEPAWTHLTQPDTLQCGSVLTRFARTVWLHAPRTSAPELFWSTL